MKLTFNFDLTIKNKQTYNSILLNKPLDTAKLIITQSNYGYWFKRAIEPDINIHRLEWKLASNALYLPEHI